MGVNNAGMNASEKDLPVFITIYEDNFFVFKEFFRKFCPHVWLVCIQEWIMMARVRYNILRLKVRFEYMY